MRYDRNYAYFRPHFEWYYFVPGIGYIPSEEAPEDAVEAMISYNAYTFGDASAIVLDTLTIDNLYIIIDEFTVKERKVLSTNKKINFQHLGAQRVKIDEQCYSYGLTHNDHWITVETDKALLGKKLVFDV